MSIPQQLLERLDRIPTHSTGLLLRLKDEAWQYFHGAE
jgi:hypothetical protein